MEIDQTIALLQKENRERIREESRQEERDLYDPKKRITYTLEELIAGIKSGKQYLYTLKMNFEPRAVLGGQWRIPFITDFYDLFSDEPDNLLMTSNKRNVSMAAVVVPNEGVNLSLQEWIDQMKTKFKEMNLYMMPLESRVVNQMEYFCYELPTSAGMSYNVQFRCVKDKQIYNGSFFCMNEEKEGMGLMLEAMVHVMEEMNR